MQAAISVVIAEDDHIAGTALATMLVRKFPGIICHLALNGKAGLELCREHQPDIVITDINMPEMDGIEMAEAILNIRENIRFILISAYDEEKYRQRLAGISISQFVPKPIRFPKLFLAVEQCIGEIRQSRNAGI